MHSEDKVKALVKKNKTKKQKQSGAQQLLCDKFVGFF